MESKQQAEIREYMKVDSLIVFLSRIIYAQWSSVTSEWGLTPPQNKILRIIKLKVNPPINELCRALNCTKGNLTGVLDSMVKSRLVRRMRSRKDRRVVRISLTEKSKQLLKTIPPWTEIYRHSLTPKLTKTEIKSLRSLLERLYSLYQQKTK